MSPAPIPRLTIDEVWYDKNNEIIPGGKGVVPGLLQPGEVQTVEIRTPSNPAMTSNPEGANIPFRARSLGED